MNEICGLSFCWFGIGAIDKNRIERQDHLITNKLPCCEIVIELEFDEPSPSRFKFESTCMIFMGFNDKSSLDWPSEKFDWLCESPDALYCGQSSEKSTPLGKLKIATDIRHSKALLEKVIEFLRLP